MSSVIDPHTMASLLNNGQQPSFTPAAPSSYEPPRQSRWARFSQRVKGFCEKAGPVLKMVRDFFITAKVVVESVNAVAVVLRPVVKACF